MDGTLLRPVVVVIVIVVVVFTEPTLEWSFNSVCKDRKVVKRVYPGILKERR